MNTLDSMIAGAVAHTFEAGIVVWFGIAFKASTPCKFGVILMQYRIVANQLRISSVLAASITYSILFRLNNNFFFLLGISRTFVKRTSFIEKQNTPLRG